MTLETLILTVVSIGSFLAAILIIWNFSKRVKSSLDESIQEVVERVLEKHDSDVKYRINCAVEASQRDTLDEIKRLEVSVQNYLKEQKEINRKDYESIKLLKASLVEAYKQDIRDIYYKLRETGEITDSDKSYVDKLFPKYKELGGNSDIEAKYAEMCRVYESLTQEAYRKARERHKQEMEERKKEIEHHKIIEQEKLLEESSGGEEE